MSPLDKIAAEFFHQAGLVPLAAAAVVHFRGMQVGTWRWALAGTLAVSWMADTAADLVIGRGSNPWPISYVYPAVQLGIVYALLLERRLAVVVLAGLAFLTVATVSQGPTSSPETVVRVSNGLFVAALAWQRPNLGVFRTSIVIYFGVGAMFQLTFPWLMTRPELFKLSWYGYQACRMIGLAAATAGMARDRRPRLALA